MSSIIQIYNAAIAKVGGKRLTDPDVDSSDSKEAQWCQDLYPLVRDAALAERIWVFASRKQILDTKSPNVAWNKSGFVVPSDVITVHRVFRNPNAREFDQTNWEKIGNYIIADLDVIYCHFVVRVSEAHYPPIFADAIANRLAAEICMPITENAKLTDYLWKRYAESITEASVADGRQGRSENTGPGEFNRARMR